MPLIRCSNCENKIEITLEELEYELAESSKNKDIFRNYYCSVPCLDSFRDTLAADLTAERRSRENEGRHLPQDESPPQTPIKTPFTLHLAFKPRHLAQDES